MLATSAAYDAVIGSNDRTIDHACHLILPLRRTNLMPNPSFEYGTTPWAPLGTSATPAVLRTTAQAHGLGGYSLRITWGTDGYLSELVGVSNGLNVFRPGSVYTFSAYVFVPTGNQAVQIVVEDGVGGPQYASAASSVTNAWQRLSVTFTATAAVMVPLVQTAAASTAGQQVYIDDLMVEQSGTLGSYFDGDNPPDVNLLDNPSFENMLMPGIWTAGATAAIARSTDWSSDGHHSLLVTPTGAAATAYADAGGGPAGLRSGMLPGRTYTLSGSVHVPVALAGATSGAAATIGVNYVSGGVHTEVVAPGGPVTGGTARVAVTATIPAGATEIWVRLYVGYDATLTNAVYFDNLMLRQDTVDVGGYFGGRNPFSLYAWTGTPGNSSSTLNVDPYPDVTVAIESVQIQRQIVSNMPSASRTVSGYPSAVATIVLSGLVDETDETKTIAWLLNPNETTSPLYPHDASDSPVYVDQGVITAVGSETVRTFSGTLDDLVIDAITQTATLTCIDNRNRLRPSVALPSFDYQSKFSSSNPGLTAGWVLDVVLRQNGVYTSPPARPSACFYASLHGAAWPELMGTLLPSPAIFFNMGEHDLEDPTSFVQNGAPSDYMDLMVEGPFGRQVVRDPLLDNVPIAGGSGNAPLLGATGHAYFEGWVYIDGTSLQGTTSGSSWGCRNYQSSSSNLSMNWAWNADDTSATCTLNLTRVAGSATKTVAGGALLTNGWHHLAQLVTFTGSTTATITTTIDGVVATDLITGLPAAGSEAVPNTLTFQWIGYADSIQITNEVAPVPYRGFYPTAYLDPSLNALTATVDVTGQDTWNVIQDLCDAEAGVGKFDTANTFWFANRNTIAAITPSRSITSTTSIKGLSVEIAKAQIYTHVQAPVNVLQESVPSAVWQASTPIRVRAHTTYSTVVSTSSPVITPQNPDSGYIGTGGGVAGQTYWRASKTAGGSTRVTTGIVVSSVNLSPTSLKISIKNSNSFDVYMVSPSTETDVSTGTPFVYVGGAFVQALTGGGVAADSQWPVEGASLNPRGDVLLSLSSNSWLQEQASAQALTDDLLEQFERPRVALQNFTIVADPSLDVGDRVTVVDPEGSKLADDFILGAITITDSASDFSQTIDARSCWPVGVFVMGVPGRAEMGSTTYV